LTDSIALGYSVKQTEVAVEGGDSLQIRSLLNNQQFFDPWGLASAQGISSATWPLFGLVWPSAQKMADLMQTWQFQNQRVLEIGCGLGLASLVLHRRDIDITASDCHPLTQTFLQKNTQLNHLLDMKYQTGHWARSNLDLGKFDLIIGSDVLYERDQPGQLAAFIGRHANMHCTVLIVDPNRSNRSAFMQSMKAIGYICHESQIVAPLQDMSPYRGRLLHFQIH
jgi:2-polyprenyl-3-methyl-5-hydroxy-6-metoxy-1,4-benzoquinol methylase